MNEYRLDGYGNVLRYSSEHNAYLFYYKEYALTRQELRGIKRSMK